MKFRFAVVLLAAMVISSFGCAMPGRIPVYSAGPDRSSPDINNSALLFVERSIKIFSIDGKVATYYPLLAADHYGGSHIYLAPGVHEIKFRFWRNIGQTRIYLKKPVTIKYHFMRGHYYDLISFWSPEMAKRREKQNVDFDFIDNGLIPTVLPTKLKEKPILN